MLVSEAGVLAKLQPFWSWHTPIAWTGYILFVDALVWKRRGDSWLSNARAEFGFLAITSVPIWVVFEMYNKYSIQNWYYVGLPESLPLRYFGYVWSFATILPAIFESAELVASFRRQPAPERSPTGDGRQPLSRARWASVAAGIAMLIVPVIYPSPYLAAPIWLGFIFLLDPLNARAGDESIAADLRTGRSDRLINLFAAGVVCGIVWEFWNYWAGTKWIYAVPILPNLRIFEMPLLGYFGFPPFAVECFVMYVAVRRWLWRRPGRRIAL